MSKIYKNYNVHANIEGGLKIGQVAANTGDGHKVLVINNSTKEVESVTSVGGGDNFVTADLTLAEDRVHDTDGNVLTIEHNDTSLVFNNDLMGLGDSGVGFMLDNSVDNIIKLGISDAGLIAGSLDTVSGDRAGFFMETGKLEATLISSDNGDESLFEAKAGTAVISASQELVISTPNILIDSLLLPYDDVAAGLGGLSAGYLYQTTGAGAAPLNVAGIVMIKQ